MTYAISLFYHTVIVCRYLVMARYSAPARHHIDNAATWMLLLSIIMVCVTILSQVTLVMAVMPRDITHYGCCYGITGMMALAFDD